MPSTELTTDVRCDSEMTDMAQSWWWRFHLGRASVCGAGVFDVIRGPGLAARLLCALLHLPSTKTGVATTVAVSRHPTATGKVAERWARNFGGRLHATTQIRRGHYSEERLGPVVLSLRLDPGPSALTIRAERCWLRLGRWRWLLPRGVSPRLTGTVRSDERLSNRFHVLIRLDMPLLGRLVQYGGYLDETSNGRTGIPERRTRNTSRTGGADRHVSTSVSIGHGNALPDDL